MMTAELLGRVAEYLNASPRATGGDVARALEVRRQDALAAVRAFRAAGVVATPGGHSQGQGTGSLALACPACGARLDVRVGRAW